MARLRNSGIGYCDFSGGILNFIIGCNPVSEGCQNCYARALYDQWGRGRDFSRVTFYPEKLKAIRSARFDSAAEYRRGVGARPIAFPVDLGDIAHHEVGDEIIKEALTTFAMRSDIDWLVLTKRIERLAELLNGWSWWTNAPPPNIAIGTTIENRRRRDERMPHLLSVPGHLWISFEPLLEPVVPLLPSDRKEDFVFVVVGAESGPKRRAFYAAYSSFVYLSAKELGIPFFGKQDSGGVPGVPLIVPVVSALVKELPVFGRGK
jgi:protein gp37